MAPEGIAGIDRITYFTTQYTTAADEARHRILSRENTMKTNGKLSLRMDDLRIESFPTTDEAQAASRGTVRANQDDGLHKEHTYGCTENNNTCWGNTCGCYTWDNASCPAIGTACIG